MRLNHGDIVMLLNGFRISMAPVNDDGQLWAYMNYIT